MCSRNALFLNSEQGQDLKRQENKDRNTNEGNIVVREEPKTQDLMNEQKQISESTAGELILQVKKADTDDLRCICSIKLLKQREFVTLVMPIFELQVASPSYLTILSV